MAEAKKPSSPKKATSKKAPSKAVDAVDPSVSEANPADEVSPEETTKPVVVASKAKSEPSAKQRIRIRLKAYDHKVIDQSTKQIVDVALRTGATIAGPIPLPTKKTIYTVVKSPHVFKKGREQFEMRVHKRLIDVYEPTPKTIDSLMNLSLPAGCDAEIKM